MTPQPARPPGAEADLHADVILPALLLAAVAASLGAAVMAVRSRYPFPALPWPGLICLLFAAESYLFTALFRVQALHLPFTLRWAEAAVALAVAKLLATVPATGWSGAFAGGWSEGPAAWVMTPVYAVAWILGGRLAALAAGLHPRHARPRGAEAPRSDELGESFSGLVQHLGYLNLAAALIVSLADAGAGRGGWTPAGAAALAGAACAAAALAVGARLRQRIAWAYQGLNPPEAVLGRWAAAAVVLAAVPLVAALLLPAGWARLPVAEWLPAAGEPASLPRVKTSAPMVDWSGMLGEWGDNQEQMPGWLLLLIRLGLYSAMAVVGLVILAVVAGFLFGVVPADLAYWSQLDWRRVPAFVAAAWRAAWHALRAALRPMVREARRAPAAAAEAIFGESGVVGRWLPAGVLRPLPGDPRAAVRACWRRLESAARRRGWPRGPGTTAAEFALILGGAAPRHAAILERLARTYEHARYDPADLPPEAAAFARRAWAVAARGLPRRGGRDRHTVAGAETDWPPQTG